MFVLLKIGVCFQKNELENRSFLKKWEVVFGNGCLNKGVCFQNGSLKLHKLRSLRRSFLRFNNKTVLIIIIMVIELSGVQFGLKSYASFQNRTSARREFDLKSQV